MIPLERRKGFRNGTGQSYYGRELEAMLTRIEREAAEKGGLAAWADCLPGPWVKQEPPPPTSVIDRFTTWYEAHWRACFIWTGIAAACLGAAWEISR